MNNRELVLLKHLRRLDNIYEKNVPWYTDRQIGRVNILFLEIDSPFNVTKSISPVSIVLRSGDYFVFFYINGYCLLLAVYPVFTPLLLLSVDLHLCLQFTLFRSARWPHLLGHHWQRLCGTPCIFLLCHSLTFQLFPSLLHITRGWPTPAAPISAWFWQGWASGRVGTGMRLGRERKKLGYFSPSHCLR